jgi:hypothetical protein
MDQNFSDDVECGFNIKSPLVRRLINGTNDPVRHRVRGWLAEMDDGQLLRLGINKRDRAALRAIRPSEQLHVTPRHCSYE